MRRLANIYKFVYIQGWPVLSPGGDLAAQGVHWDAIWLPRVLRSGCPGGGGSPPPMRASASSPGRRSHGGSGGVGQPGSSNRLGTSSSEVPKLLVHSEVDSGPMGVPAPSRRPTVWSDSIILVVVEVAVPLLSYLRSATLPPRWTQLENPKTKVFWEKEPET